MTVELRVPLFGSTIQFDVGRQEMVVVSEGGQTESEGPGKIADASEWWETIMQEPFIFGAGPWHFARGSVAAKLSSGADVTGEGAEMEYDTARKPLRDALRFAIETNIPTLEVFDQINKEAYDMRHYRNIEWASLYADAVKAEYNLLREEIEIEKSASH